MGYVVYVLRDSKNRLYKGVTNDLKRRMSEHMAGKTKTTARMKDIRIAYTEKFATFDDARRRELYFKSAAGRRFLAKVLHP